jgi:hypothetical protein
MNGFRVLNRAELKSELESFNNCYVSHIDGWWMYFRATPFAAKGIKRELGRKVEGMLENEYRIFVSNNPTNHK